MKIISHVGWIVTALMAAISSASDAAPARQAVHLEAAQGQLSGGVTVTAARPGFTGKGYVTGFVDNTAAVVCTIPYAVGGLYDMHIRYSAPSGPKGYTVVVDGSASSGMFAATGNVWAVQDAGSVELQTGANTLTIQRGWGYFDINSIDLTPAVPAPLPKQPPATPSDPQATPAARALLRYLVSGYGHKTLSGQYDEGEADYVRQVAGQTPAILGGDFIEYSPSRLAHGSDPKNETERMIQSAHAGHIVTMTWHWNAPIDLLDTPAQPWFKGFYTSATTFDVQDALAHPQSQNYQFLLRDMDAIAAQLQKFSDAGVPVLWRPLHEAQGGWFWWGAKGPGPFKTLWRLMYDRFTRVHHLHNLIWVDCSGTDPAWYPGDAYVDVVGIDEYPSDVSDALDSDWLTLQHEYGGRKLVALTEFGGVPDIDKMFRFGVRWDYFVSWTGDVGPHKMTPQALTRIYDSSQVVNESKLSVHW